MTTVRQLPREWRLLPQWVKNELTYGTKELPFYNWHIQQLVDHDDSMKTVWRLFENNRHHFIRKGTVHSLLRLLHQSTVGLDPGQPRTDTDRRSIADDVSKHVNALIKLIGRLGTGGAFGAYPLGVMKSIDAVAIDFVKERCGRQFDACKKEFQAILDEDKFPADAKNPLMQQLDCLQSEIELEGMNLLMDSRISLKALADSTSVWAKTCGWSRNDSIWYIGSTLKDWFGCNQFSATATLATAIRGEEISRDSVAGIMKRKRV